jgi:diadenylate cyclase
LLEQLKNLKTDFFNITTLIDVLIVILFLYWLVLLIRGTRAVQLIKGLVVLLVATAVSNWLKLHTVHWLLSQVITALLVALPVVFQPELRRALEKLGGGEIFTTPLPHLGEDDHTQAISELVRAVGVLSKEKTGAILVLERNTGLEEYIDKGIKIGGIISAELLLNIFVPRTPLHDGAVIIRGNRIAAAACVLPLAEGMGVSRELGTRHRAAIGITEVSDALAVIVSEETGGISLAVEGFLARELDEDTLISRLMNALQPKPTRSLTFLWRRK